MGDTLGCCNTPVDEANFKEYCMTNAGHQYLPLLTAILNDSQPPTQHNDQIRGDWLEGAPRTGQGVIFAPGKFYYEGAVVEGKASGEGRIFWENRTCYEGSVTDNQASGSGTLRVAEDETVIRGEWLHGEPVLGARMELTSRTQNFRITFLELRRAQESPGELESALARIEFAEGLTYEGEVRRKQDGQFRIDGRGTLRFAEGSEYVGEFESGKMHGHGRYRWAATGHWFEGEYKFNYRDGAGTYYYSHSRFKTGSWKAGVLQTQPAEAGRLWSVEPAGPVQE